MDVLDVTSYSSRTSSFVSENDQCWEFPSTNSEDCVLASLMLRLVRPKVIIMEINWSIPPPLRFVRQCHEDWYRSWSMWGSTGFFAIKKKKNVSGNQGMLAWQHSSMFSYKLPTKTDCLTSSCCFPSFHPSPRCRFKHPRLLSVGRRGRTAALQLQAVASAGRQRIFLTSGSAGRQAVGYLDPFFFGKSDWSSKKTKWYSTKWVSYWVRCTGLRPSLGAWIGPKFWGVKDRNLFLFFIKPFWNPNGTATTSLFGCNKLLARRSWSSPRWTTCYVSTRRTVLRNWSASCIPACWMSGAEVNRRGLGC